MNLYELTDEFLQLQQMLEDPDIDSDVINDTLEAVGGEIEVKADGYAKVIRNMEGTITAIKQEQERLANKRSLLESNIKRLKDNLQQAMVTTGKTKFKTDLFSFNIQKNGGALPVVVDVTTDKLPDECVIITEKPDLKALAAFLQDPVFGDLYKQYAHFGVRGESLRIK